jgi:hypothetical protein
MIKFSKENEQNSISLFYSESEPFNTGIELINSETEHLLAATNSRLLGFDLAYTAQILDKHDKQGIPTESTDHEVIHDNQPFFNSISEKNHKLDKQKTSLC